MAKTKVSRDRNDLELRPHERIVWRGRSATSVTSIVMIAGGTILLIFILPVLLLVAGIFAFLNSRSLRYWITNQRVIAIRNFPKHERVEVPIGRVLRTRVHRSIFHKLRGIADFHLVTSEDTEHDIVLRRVRSPQEIERILRDIQKSSGR